MGRDAEAPRFSPVYNHGMDIADGIAIPDEELQFTFARSGGPGGQNVNKVASKAVLRWDALGTPFAVDLEPAQSATGEHRMLSVFLESADASVTVNGRRLPGKAFPRPLFGRSVSSAFLASSETWLRA